MVPEVLGRYLVLSQLHLKGTESGAVSEGAEICALHKIHTEFTERTPSAYLGDRRNATL